VTSIRFNPAKPHQAFVNHWTSLHNRGELGNVPMARAYRKPLAAELDSLANGESGDQGARARAILWNGYGKRFIEHLGLRMGESPRHTKAADAYFGSVFLADRLQTPLSPEAFQAEKPMQLEPGSIPDLENAAPSTLRVWELLIRGGARFRTDESRKVHLNPLIYTLQTVQRRLGNTFLFLQDGKDLYLRLTAPEAVENLAQMLGCPAKHSLAYYGELAPWEDYTQEENQDFWPISLMGKNHDIPPFLGVHPFLFGWHDVFHREQHEASAGTGQNMATTLVRAALHVLPEMATWDETAQTFELLAQMDPLASRPRHIQMLGMELCAGLRMKMKKQPDARDRIDSFFSSLNRQFLPPVDSI
jgi:hypothetical protein